MNKLMITSAALCMAWMSTVCTDALGAGACFMARHADMLVVRHEARMSDLRAAHFAVRAKTACWSVALVCNGDRCSVRDPQQARGPGCVKRYLAISTSDGAL